ncbi:hypothetical protein F7734_50535 [Scytonema sp. UIC 10036]|uniref:hypothetical protein n=1 Tax=Scytonema sp. UIC 10036 TaxID=2304196 RepID=UPI0012DAD637|nr:hypothetical protein [Scytonema sp. UIC 10036]MUH00080.1 hypothetical protein [Scytonema sp. UIC 10036]
MPRKGTLTGANLENSKRGVRGGLTGSKRLVTETEAVQSPEATSAFESSPEVASVDEAARNNLKEKLQQAGQVVSPVVGAVGEAVKGAVGAAAQGVANKVTATVNGSIDYNPSSLSNGSVDTAGILSKADAEIDESVPQLDSGEAIKRNITIARQRNFVGVAINNTKLKQDLATLDLEQQRLIGLLIDGKTARIDNEKKAITYHRSIVSRDTEISKLNQDRELLVQQNIRTEGTQNQTELIREQEQLKVDKLREQNEKVKYEIQNIAYEKEKIKQEAVAKFAAGF